MNFTKPMLHVFGTGACAAGVHATGHLNDHWRTVAEARQPGHMQAHSHAPVTGPFRGQADKQALETRGRQPDGGGAAPRV